MKLLGNKKEEEEQEAKAETPQIEESKVVPEVGNMPNAQATPVLSPKDLEALNRNKQARIEAEEHNRIFGKFFSLEIGEETIVTIIPSKCETFKTKAKSGDLLNQFRYYLIDVRAPDREKQFDTWASVSEQIDKQLENGKLTMKIRAEKSQSGQRKYVIYDA